jgi:hypothetical protein
LKKHLASRIFGLAALYCAVFFVLVILQFSGRGNFTISANAMIIKGRYLELNESGAVVSNEDSAKLLTGGVRVFFGGLEFNLKDDHGGGLILTGIDGAVIPVNPKSLEIDENTVRLGLPGGSTLIFNSSGSAATPELQINAEFAQDVSEVTIPIIPRRSLVRNNGQLGIMYNGSRYIFNGSGQELENNNIVFSKGNTFISYRSSGKQRSFEPSNYIIPQAQNYYYAVSNWQDLSFARWNQNAALLNNEDDITGYMSEALRQNNYAAALEYVSSDYINAPQHSYKSSAYLGGMVSAYRSFTSEENRKLNTITLLIRENPLDVLKEEHIIDYLLTRGNTVLAHDIIQLIQNTNSEKLIIDYCSGLLEAYSDIKRWNPSIKNPVEPLVEQILLLVSENLNKDTSANLVYASSSKERDLYYSVRLGNALISWADDVNNTEWADIGRSLVLSALTNAGPGAGNLYSNLKPAEYYPKALWLADNGLWTWTASPSVRAFWTDSNLNIAFSFPVNMTHHVIIRGVKPFIKLQIHGMDWRTDSQFERYDSSGWAYYSQDQILILKLRHRLQVENIRIVYRLEEPPPVIEEDTAVTGENNIDL